MTTHEKEIIIQLIVGTISGIIGAAIAIGIFFAFR